MTQGEARRKDRRGGESVLVVDDSEASVEIVRRNLVACGYRVFTAPCVADAVKTLERVRIDLVVTDYKMPEASGMDLVRHVRENHAETEVIMITGYASVEGAVEAVKTGAEEYLAKPFTEDELIAAVTRAIDKLGRRRSVSQGSSDRPAGFIGDSGPMRMVYAAIDKAARTTATVLITGESGTGKELVARSIHYRSHRASAPFVAVNCGGIPESLLESELFGHVRGAFTGATETRAGFFQTADGGTIFLDEASETTPAMQVKLLRVLQDTEVCMVGSTRPSKVDVRVIAATNKDLSSLVRRGQFREDLYYRLNVISIEVPPLRDRGLDILAMIGQFAAKYAAEADRKAPGFSDRAVELLGGYHWPGNVRELENTIHRLVVMSDRDVIDAPDLPALMRVHRFGDSDLGRSLAEVEAEHIRNVLESVGGNKSRAAEILGIDRKTLREKIKVTSDR